MLLRKEKMKMEKMPDLLKFATHWNRRRKIPNTQILPDPSKFSNLVKLIQRLQHFRHQYIFSK